MDDQKKVNVCDPLDAPYRPGASNRARMEGNEFMIIPKSRWENLIVLGLLAVCIFFMATFLYGIVAKTILIPERNTKIEYFQSQVDVFKNRSIELEEYIRDQSQKFKLANRWGEFLEMMCDKDQKVRLDFVRDYIAKTKNLYKPIPVKIKTSTKISSKEK